MIAKQRTVANARDVEHYLRFGSPGKEVLEKDRVDWTSTRNLLSDDPTVARQIMEATARLSDRVEKPFYTVSVSFHPDDKIDRKIMEYVADEVLKDLGLQDHQALIVAHKDRDHDHFHILANRVDLETGRAWKNSHDYAKTDATLRRLEKELGLIQVQTWRTDPEIQQEMASVPRPSQVEFVEKLRAKNIPEILRQSQQWGELEDRLSAYGLVVQRSGRGLQITDGVNVAKMSALHRKSSLANLEKRFAETWKEWAERSPSTAFEPGDRRGRSTADPVVLERAEEVTRRAAEVDKAKGKNTELAQQVDDLFRKRQDAERTAETAQRSAYDQLRAIQPEHRPKSLDDYKTPDESQLVGKRRILRGDDEQRKLAKQSIQKFEQQLPDVLETKKSAEEMKKLHREKVDAFLEIKDRPTSLPEAEIYKLTRGVPAAQLKHLPPATRKALSTANSKAIQTWDTFDELARIQVPKHSKSVPKSARLLAKNITKRSTVAHAVFQRALPLSIQGVMVVIKGIHKLLKLQRKIERQIDRGR